MPPAVGSKQVEASSTLPSLIRPVWARQGVTCQGNVGAARHPLLADERKPAPASRYFMGRVHVRRILGGIVSLAWPDPGIVDVQRSSALRGAQADMARSARLFGLVMLLVAGEQTSESVKRCRRCPASALPPKLSRGLAHLPARRCQGLAQRGRERCENTGKAAASNGGLCSFRRCRRRCRLALTFSLPLKGVPPLCHRCLRLHLQHRASAAPGLRCGVRRRVQGTLVAGTHCSCSLAFLDRWRLPASLHHIPALVPADPSLPPGSCKTCTNNVCTACKSTHTMVSSGAFKQCMRKVANCQR